MASKGKGILAAALLLALGAAVYLNWQYTPVEELTADAPGETHYEDELGSAQYVTAQPQNDEEVQETSSVSTDGEIVETGKKSNAFEDMRAERERTRNEAFATLQDIIDDATLGSSEKTAAVNTMAMLTERMEQESSIETLIKGKGYTECVAVISETQVNILVPADENGLTSSDAAIIKDIVIGQVNISPSSIKIIEAK